jgi:hypothetical protein
LHHPTTHTPAFQALMELQGCRLYSPV